MAKISLTTKSDIALDLDYNSATRALSITAKVYENPLKGQIIYEDTFADIGDYDPVSFLVGQNAHYISGRKFGVPARQPDLIRTIISLRDKITAEHREGDIDLDRKARIDNVINESLSNFSGDHEASCLHLIDEVRFDYDIKVETRHAHEHIAFSENLWKPLIKDLGHHHSEISRALSESKAESEPQPA